MRPILPWLLALLAGCASLSAGGCTSRPPPADPALAREILSAALDAWKRGEESDSLQDRDPPIFVADREWAAGKKLVNYKVDEKDRVFGAALRCSVQLTFDVGMRGKPRTRKATYCVGTNERLTVVREDDD
jgi:hypothetical protein